MPQLRVRVFKGKGQGQPEDTPGLPLPITKSMIRRSPSSSSSSPWETCSRSSSTSSRTCFFDNHRSERRKRMSNESCRREPRKKTCLGITHPPACLEEAVASRHAESYSSSAKTCQESSHSSESPTISLRGSLPPNGTAFSEANQLISTRFSPPCTLSTLMKRERDARDELRSFLLWR